MNAVDVLKYGHQTVLRTIDGLPESEWTTEGVCGWWSTRHIIAHLGSYELLLVDVLTTFLDGGPTPCLDQFLSMGMEFNDAQVEMRNGKTPEEVLAEYNEAHARVMALIPQVPEERRRQAGALPWYGMEYDLEDFIAYQYYGHKREHSAQIAVFLDTLKQ